MRLIAVCLLASGCQLVFSHQDEPAPPDSEGPARGELTITSLELIDPPPFLVGEDHPITAGFAGDDRPVHYRWATNIGQTDITGDIVTLADGIGTATAVWTAPAMLERGRVVLEASYNPDFSDSVVGMIDVAAHEQFGILTTPTFLAISTAQLIATPVTIGAPGEAVSFSVKASGMGQVQVGIYADNGVGPSSLLAMGTQPLFVDGSLEFEAVDFTIPVPVRDRVWLAVLVKPTGTIQLGNVDISSTQAPRSVVANGMNEVTLPSTFPPAVSNPNHYAMFVTVGPAP